MNETVLPDVTTMRLVCGESSIDVIGPGNVKCVVNVRVRRSHHLYNKPKQCRENRSIYKTAQSRCKISLDQPVLSGRYTRVVAHPDNTLDVRDLAHLALYQPVLYCGMFYPAIRKANLVCS